MMKIRTFSIRGWALTAGAASLIAASAAAQSFGVVFDFNGTDGAQSQAPLIIDAAGNLYGTTSFGGSSGAGNVFELVKEGSSYTMQALHSFTGGPDGGGPVAGLVMDGSGNLYGTTSFGGASNHGAIFELVNEASSYSFQVLYSFTGGADGSDPVADLVIDASGNLFGTAAEGGSFGSGTVFELVKAGSSYTIQTLYSFSALPSVTNPTNADGGIPEAALLRDDAGNLYGTAAFGGSFSVGTVFELVKSASSYTFQVLHTFTDGLDGGRPVASLVADASGNLYSTASGGGMHGWGAIFELSKGISSYDFQTLYSFNNDSDGAIPLAPLILDDVGNLTGTALSGGDFGFGTVFQLVRGSSSDTLRTLYSFLDGFDGASPVAGLISDGSGKLFGTAFAGGTFEWGTVFSLTPPPTAVSQRIVTLPDTPVEITLSATDPNLASPSFTFAIETPPVHGTLSSIAGDVVTYTPSAGFTGSDSFAFTATDADGVSNPASVSITISLPVVRRVVPVPTTPPVRVEPRPER